MLKTIKTIYNIFAEEERKEKARRKFVSKMSLEEYQAYKAASSNLNKRREAINYQKSNCSSTAEYDMNPVNLSFEIIGKTNNPRRKKAFGGWGLCYYEDNDKYKCIKTETPSINQQIKNVENSKDFNIIESLLKKYM